MGNVCNELIISCESKHEDIFDFVSAMVEGMAHSCDMSDDGSIDIIELYCDPDSIIADISKKFPNIIFNASASVLSEGSGEMMDIAYKYNGQLETQYSDWYGEREKAIKNSYYSESIWITIKWKNTNDELEKDAQNLLKMIFQKTYSKACIPNLNIEEWENNFRVNISGKKNKELLAIYEYKLSNPKQNDILDIYNADDFYNLLTSCKNDSFPFTILYSYIDDEDIIHYVRYDSKKDKAEEEAGELFYSDMDY